jgi:hypothetical protein
MEEAKRGADAIMQAAELGENNGGELESKAMHCLMLKINRSRGSVKNLREFSSAFFRMSCFY